MKVADWRASNMDYGVVWQRDKRIGLDGLKASRMHALVEAELQYSRWWRAHEDSAFQAFLVRVGAVKLRRPRVQRKLGSMNAAS
jgi:GH15 family glucan-1,4-alpha-glucosidase